jgi:hypothetical protein
MGDVDILLIAAKATIIPIPTTIQVTNHIRYIGSLDAALISTPKRNKPLRRLDLRLKTFISLKTPMPQVLIRSSIASTCNM